MYIITTAKRIKQITFFLIFAAAAIGLIFWMSWRATFVTGPAQLIEGIRTTQQVSLSESALKVARNQLRDVIKNQLTENLTASNIDTASETAALMLPKASEFLKEEEEINLWINQQIAALPTQESAWQLIQTSTNEQTYQIAEVCLTIVRQDKQWQFKQLTPCIQELETAN